MFSQSGGRLALAGVATDARAAPLDAPSGTAQFIARGVSALSVATSFGVGCEFAASADGDGGGEGDAGSGSVQVGERRRLLERQKSHYQSTWCAAHPAVHQLMHSLSGPMKAFLLEAQFKPRMTDGQIIEFCRSVELSIGRVDRLDEDRIRSDLVTLVVEGVLAQMDNTYVLTPAGLKASEHMALHISQFMRRYFSETTATVLALIVNVLLAAAKLTLAILGHSSGVLADGIDNGGDILSAAFVWIGVRFKINRLMALLVILVMTASFGLIVWGTVSKFMAPVPIDHPYAMLGVEAGSAIVCALLSVYQFFVGRRSSNFGILAQAVDMRNHVYQSFAVCIAIACSIIAENITPWWRRYFLYGDPVASSLVGLLIGYSIYELLVEFFMGEGGEDDGYDGIQHWLNARWQKAIRANIASWVQYELRDGAHTSEELHTRFIDRFVGAQPLFVRELGVSYRPEGGADLDPHLAFLVKKGMISRNDEHGVYYLRAHAPWITHDDVVAARRRYVEHQRPAQAQSSPLMHAVTEPSLLTRSRPMEAALPALAAEPVLGASPLSEDRTVSFRDEEGSQSHDH